MDILKYLEKLDLLKDVEKLNLFVYPVSSVSNRNIKIKNSILLTTICDTLLEFEIKDALIFEITDYAAYHSKKEVLDFINRFESSNEFVIFTKSYSSYLSDDEEYKTSWEDNPDEHFDEIMDKASNKLKELGFIDVRELRGDSDNPIPFIYPNELGKRLINHWHDTNVSETKPID